MIAEAELVRNCVTGRMEIASPVVRYKSRPQFTPFDGSKIDLKQLSIVISEWLQESQYDVKEISSGGVIVTGLAAKKDNAIAIKELLKKTVSASLMITADDPHLESWLAFKGNCEEMSRNHPTKKFLNLDIGGGTTNLAVGKNGNVISTGCLFVGARHFVFDPGTYLLKDASQYGKKVLDELAVAKRIGQTLTEAEVQKIVSYYIQCLEDLSVDKKINLSSYARLFDYAPPNQISKSVDESILTFSGGVGELVYLFSEQSQQKRPSFFGDLGEELAWAILKSSQLSKDLKTFPSKSGGRATVYGITLYEVQVSGSTTFCSSPELLPIDDIPVIASLDLLATESSWHDALAAALFGGKVVGYYVKNASNLDDIKRFADVFKKLCRNSEATIVFFLNENIGKTLGNYLTDWQQLPIRIVVIDEISTKNARFASIGKPVQNSIPVSFYGLIGL